MALAAGLLLAAGVAIAMWPRNAFERGETPSAATFGFQDWLVRCQAVKETMGCGMSQQILDQRAQQPLLQLHLARAPSGTGHQLVLVLPLGVSVPAGVGLQVGDERRDAQFTQCLPGGCVAPLAVDAALIEKLKSATDGRVGVVDRAGKPVAIPFSLKGFASAFEKMESFGSSGKNDATWWSGFWNSSGTK
ncbi:MAG: invasion associated locus B family protein [Alphaproteobacteria bacterium]|nr:invasion associated locus B family protein [Alphaproteobacteria bacterium]